MEVKYPEIIHSKAYLDFGKGFYVTTFQKQAELWALRKAIRQGKDPVINTYTAKAISLPRLVEKYMDSVKWK